VEDDVPDCETMERYVNYHKAKNELKRTKNTFNEELNVNGSILRQVYKYGGFFAGSYVMNTITILTLPRFYAGDIDGGDFIDIYFTKYQESEFIKFVALMHEDYNELNDYRIICDNVITVGHFRIILSHMRTIEEIIMSLKRSYQVAITKDHYYISK